MSASAQPWTAPSTTALRWLVAGTLGAVATGTVVVTLHVLTGWPPPWAAWAAILPLLGGAWCAASRRGPAAARTWLRAAAVCSALSVLVAAVFTVVVLGLGAPPDAEGRRLLGGALVAAGVVALLAVPVRARVRQVVDDLVGRTEPTVGDVLPGLSARMSRAVPLDELLLGIAEQLRAAVATAGVEVWTGFGQVLERTVSVPDVGPARIVLAERELDVVAHARLGGAAWCGVWLPGLGTAAAHRPDGAEGTDLRVAPVAHLGALHGLVVARDRGFSPEDERVLVEVARQLGLALHNVRLDSALQRSLEDLERANADLRASRLRLVAASDEARRRIERDLHDGAQQRLVAIAVQLALVEARLSADPEEARASVAALREEVQETVREVRELAHGIYPPLLRDRGLAEALRSAAGRGPGDVAVDVDVPGRYPADVESAVYFCCVEALANAAKHAGPGAEVRVAVGQDGPDLWFEVSDDGAGLALGPDLPEGHGFVNMADRVGALGGTLVVDGAPDEGCVVRGRVPLPSEAARPTAAAPAAPEGPA